MKKALCILSVCMMAIFVTTPVCGAGTYNVIQLTDNTDDEGHPRISGSYAVWSVTTVNQSPTEVYVYDGSIVINISNDPSHRDQGPDINAKGQVAWRKIPGVSDQYSEIYLYDGTGPAINISNDPSYRDLHACISNNGYVAWQREWPPEATSPEIYLYNGSTVVNISNDPYNKDKYPLINSDGQVVCWYKYVGTDKDIYLYDGTGSAINISNDPSCIDDLADINAKGHVVWNKNPGPSGDREIYLYDGTGPAINISNDPSHNDYGYPRINSHGQVVWHKYTGSNDEIYLYDGTGPAINISNDPSHNDEAPDINANGQVVWSKDIGSDNEIYLYDGTGPAINISNNPSYKDYSPRISDNGDVVWYGHGSDYEIFFASPASGGDGSKVGGIGLPINKVRLLAPWMALAAVILLGISIMASRRFRKKFNK